MADVELNFDLTESDVRDYLARSALGFEPLIDVFPDKEKLGSVPVFATAALLVSYRGHGRDWWDYLNEIEEALEIAAPLPDKVVPALLLLSRRNRALKDRNESRPPASRPARPRTA